MAQTPSNMMPLGTRAPSFTLPDTVSGRPVALDNAKGSKGTVVLFICNHCPYVKHINAELVRVAKEFQPRGVAFIAISSNDVANYPDDAPDKMKQNAQEQGYPFPYLYDETQQVAKVYDAACTPDIFVFDGALKCVYRGQFDDTRPNKGTPTGKDLRAALGALVEGKSINADQKPSVGCNIKWRKA